MNFLECCLFITANRSLTFPLVFMPSKVVEWEDDMETVAAKFQHSGKYNLVVLKDGKYIGFVSRANVFSQYRKLLNEFSED